MTLPPVETRAAYRVGLALEELANRRNGGPWA